jgi:guanylate cyclase
VGRLRRLINRLVAIGDDPGDDDDGRLRRRVGVVAGYLTIIAPLPLPIQALGHPLSWVLAASLSVFSALNLLLLARTRRFDRYVIALIAFGTVWVPLATIVGGGITGSSPGLVWAFLVPAYAILALGPRRATPWFVAFLLSLAVMAAVDPFAQDAFGLAPYEMRLAGAVANAVLPLAIVFILLRYTDLRRRKAEARSDELLTNAIPASIAARLKHGEQRIAETYPNTTVLFADIAGFTPWSSSTDPDRVIGVLDDLFTRFDALAADCGLEKIKTIGDAYMAVAGAPEARVDHAAAAIRMSRGMLGAAADWRVEHDVALELRIGLASGSVVGGVIGQRRILFDLWGDTVNTASRMESFGLPGRVHVATTTWELLRDRDEFEPRNLEIKGLGAMTTYLLSRPRTVTGIGS